MGRSQRHMIWEHGANAAGAIHDEGVVAPGIAMQVDPSAPAGTLKAGPPLYNTGLEWKGPPDMSDVVVPIGDPGGPLSGSSLTGAIPEELQTPDGGGGTEPDPNAPRIDSLDPASTTVNNPVQVTITGGNFTADCVVLVNGNQVVSAFVSDTSMTADMPGALQEGTAAVIVNNPTTQLQSPSVPFNVTAAEEEPQGGRSFPIGPITIATVDDHADGIAVTLSEASDVQVGDTVLIEATGNTSVNGSYSVLTSDGTTVVVDNNFELLASIEAKGRLTVTG